MTDITLGINSVYSSSVFSSSYFRTGVSTVTLDRVIEYGLRGSARHAGRETLYQRPTQWFPHENIKRPLEYTIVCRGGNTLVSNLLTLFREHTWVAMDDDGDGQTDWDILITDLETDYEAGRSSIANLWRIRLNFYRRPSKDIVLWLKGDYGQGSIAFDSSKYLNHSTFAGNTTWGTGQWGYGFEFDGDNDYITVPYSSELKLRENFSILGWAYLTQKAGATWQELNHGILRCAEWKLVVDATGTPCLLFGRNSSAVWGSATSTIALSWSTWFFFGMVWSSNAVTFYVNTTSESLTLSSPSDDYTGDLTIGRDISNQEELDGALDEVVVINRALTSAEVEKWRQNIA